MKTTHKVHVLHKCLPEGNRLAVGKTFVFPTGDRYTVQENGSVINADPKPYRSKSERKQYLRARRAERPSAL